MSVVLVPPKRGPLTAGRCVALIATVGALGQAAQILDRLEFATAGDALPPGWEARSVGEAAPAGSQVVEDVDGVRWLSVTATGAASQFWMRLDDPLSPGRGTLSWSWRVDQAIDGTNLADPDRDDAPARLFVVFGEGGFLSSPRALFYSWGGDRPTSRTFRSHVSDDIGVFVLRTAGDPLNGWLPESRHVAADYERVFDETPTKPITAVGFMIDTDQTGATASSGLRALRWVPSPPGIGLRR